MSVEVILRKLKIKIRTKIKSLANIKAIKGTLLSECRK
jgi:hypothetical protein